MYKLLDSILERFIKVLVMHLPWLSCHIQEYFLNWWLDKHANIQIKYRELISIIYNVTKARKNEMPFIIGLVKYSADI